MRERRTRQSRQVGTDWPTLDALTDDQFEQMAFADVENPATTVDEWTIGFIDLLPGNNPVNAKFDVDVVAWFKAQGRGYQTRMNAVLRHDLQRIEKLDRTPARVPQMSRTLK